MKKSSEIILIVLGIIAIIAMYSYAVAATGPVEPLGRAAFVKLLNPDFYPDHPHSQLLEKYAADRGSPCALVVHYAGTSNYRSYQDDDVYIIELGFVSSAGPQTEIDWGQALQYAIFGVPDDAWKFRINGVDYDNFDDAWAVVMEEAQAHGQQGPIPMVWHGSARSGNPILNPGCGFPLYYYICWKQYGRFAAYYYAVSGLIFPYFNSPFKNFELKNYKVLQSAYTSGRLDYTKLSESEIEGINASLSDPSIFTSVYMNILSKRQNGQKAIYFTE